MADKKDVFENLKGRLKLSGKENGDSERFAGLLEQISVLPKGMQVLERMAQNKCRFYFEPEAGYRSTGFIPSLNAIFMNSKMGDDVLAPALLKESEYVASMAERGNQEILKNALCVETYSDREKFGRLVDRAYQTRIGKEVLDQVADIGYSFSFQNLAMSGIKGVCHSDEKTIVISSAASEPEQLTTLLHEAVHAVQCSRFGKQTSNMNAADYFKVLRAVEADATAHETAFAYQLKEIYPPAYQAAMESPMMQAYVKERDAGKTEPQAAAASFEAWYDFAPYQRTYENDHKNLIKQVCKRAAQNRETGHLQDSCTNEEVLSICLMNDKPYVPVSFLSCDKARAVSKQTQIEIAEASKALSAATGEKVDMSILGMPVRENMSVEKQKNINPAVGVKFKITGGRE